MNYKRRSSMIRFDNVTKRFADGTEALKNVSVTIPTHKLTAIIGPSGCGKTTLMRMINRLEVPTEGAVYIDELPISNGMKWSYAVQLAMSFNESASFLI